MAPEWLKFNDSVVTRAAYTEATNDNFGGPSTMTYAGHGGGTYQKDANGYMLVYVRQTDAPTIYQRVDDSFIPQHLKDYVAQDDDRETASGPVEFSALDESALVRNCANGKAGFECKALIRKAEFVKNKDTNKVVYERIAALFKVLVDEIRIWLAHTAFSPWTVLENKSTALTHIYYTTLFVQRKPATEPVSETGQFTYFVKFYHPALQRPLQYIGSFTVPKSDLISALFPVVSAKLGFPGNTQYDVYEEVGQFVRKLPSMVQSGFSVQTIILQLFEGATLFDTEYSWVTETPDSPPASAESQPEQAAASDSLPMYAWEAAESSVDKFLSGTVTALLFQYDRPNEPVARVTFSPKIPLAELKKRAASVLGTTFDPQHDAFLVYQQDYSDPTKPESTALSQSDISYHFRGKEQYRIFARFVPGIAEAKLGALNDQDVAFSEDGYTTTRSMRIFIERTQKIGAIRQMLIKQGFIPDNPDLRFCTVWSSTIEKIVVDFQDTLASYQQIRIDVPPPDQKEPEALVVPVALAINETYLRFTGMPFFFALRKQETVKELGERIKTALKIGEEEFKKVQLMISRDARPTYLTSGTLLKGDKTIGEIIAPFGDTKLKLFVLHPPAAGKSRYHDQSLKIYN
jgi:hypothetical protein